MAKYEEGRYVLRVAGQRFNNNKSGNLQFCLDCEVVSRFDPATAELIEVENLGNRTIFRQLQTKDGSPVDRNGKSMMDSLRDDVNSVFGTNLQVATSLHPDYEDFVSLAGREFEANMKYWGDNDNEGWEWVRPNSSGPVATLADLEKLAALTSKPKAQQKKKLANPNANPLLE